MAHAIVLTSTLGKTLLFANMTAREQLGRLFSYQIEMISRNADVDLRSLLGTPMTVTLTTPQGYTRYFNGIVSEAEQGGFQVIQDVRYAVYKATLVPKPWLLTRQQDCRIYKSLSVPEIVRTVLGEAGYGDVKLSLSGNYPPREYCVQYRETTFDFISRLMEQEGIYYFFTHTSGTHTMVLADALGAHSTVPTFEQISYAPPTEKDHRVTSSITDWETGRTVNPTRVQLTDYDYLHPRTSLLATEEVTDAADAHGISGLDIFDYPGYHQLPADGQRYAQVRVDALNVGQSTCTGSTDACGLATGVLFKLKDFPLAEANQEYLVTEAVTRLVEVDYLAGGGGDDGEVPFACTFSVIKSGQPFRSLPLTRRPTIAGVQTAVVYGETPEDIVVDKYGRVVVTFFWNQPGKKNADNSCPVRVASHWAGKRWGAVQIPRVGQEVVVSFLEGNPDRPLIIGSVYNADNMPPYTLPDNKTQSGVKSRSLLGGTEEYNEIRFEDKSGSEELFLHAQKDMREEVENDHVVTIDHDETAQVKHDRTHTVGNDDTIHVGKTFTLEAGTRIELISGASSIVLNSSGQIEIKGINVTISGAVEVGIDAGANLSLHSDVLLEATSTASVLVKSTLLNLRGDALAELTGGALIIA